MPYTVEVCVDSIQSAIDAAEGGADRLELCSGLAEGGLTPSHGFIAAVCKAVNCKVHVLIRPRSGDFVYSAEEVDIIRSDILHAASLGAHGVVIGFLNPNATINTDILKQLTDLCIALNLDITFHRAFDVVHDQRRALSDLIGCGIKRVLTSGGAPTAMEGLENIAALVKEGGSRISIMPAAGVDADNCIAVVRCTGATEIHGTFRTAVPSPMRWIHPRVHFSLLNTTTANSSNNIATLREQQQEEAAAVMIGGVDGGRGGQVKGQGDAKRWQRLVTDMEMVAKVVAVLAAEDDADAMG